MKESVLIQPEEEPKKENPSKPNEGLSSIRLEQAKRVGNEKLDAIRLEQAKRVGLVDKNSKKLLSADGEPITDEEIIRAYRIKELEIQNKVAAKNFTDPEVTDWLLRATKAFVERGMLSSLLYGLPENKRAELVKEYKDSLTSTNKITEPNIPKPQESPLKRNKPTRPDLQRPKRRKRELKAPRVETPRSWGDIVGQSVKNPQISEAPKSVQSTLLKFGTKGNQKTLDDKFETAEIGAKEKLSNDQIAEMMKADEEVTRLEAEKEKLLANEIETQEIADAKESMLLKEKTKEMLKEALEIEKSAYEFDATNIQNERRDDAKIEKRNIIQKPANIKEFDAKAQQKAGDIEFKKMEELRTARHETIAEENDRRYAKDHDQIREEAKAIQEMKMEAAKAEVKNEKQSQISSLAIPVSGANKRIEQLRKYLTKKTEPLTTKEVIELSTKTPEPAKANIAEFKPTPTTRENSQSSLDKAIDRAIGIARTQKGKGTVIVLKSLEKEAEESLKYRNVEIIPTRVGRKIIMARTGEKKDDQVEIHFKLPRKS